MGTGVGYPVTVVGCGRMGQAYSQRLKNVGLPVSCVAPTDFKTSLGKEGNILILALRAGTDTRLLIQEFNRQPNTYILDLTTQSIADSQVCIEEARVRGLYYFGGGVAGGAEQARIGKLCLLLGPPLIATVTKVAAALGSVIEFKDAITASAAKLLHNLVLILHNHSLALALRLAEESGIAALENILDIGTAGRPPSRASVTRDYRNAPRSSYTSGLVAKDLKALLASFPTLISAAGIDFPALVKLYDSNPDVCYTVNAIEKCLGRKTDESS